MMKRLRGLLMTSLLLTSAVTATTLAGLGETAHANAPQSKLLTPGWYRMALGDFEITVLSDGSFPLPVDKVLTGTTPAKVEAALKKSYLTTQVETSVNCFLVNTGTKLVLIDTGAGKLFAASLGKLLINLKAAGYSPEQVDEIYITHMHPDHVGGLAVDGKPAFPNAIIRAHKAEGEQWLTQANADKAPNEAKPWFQGAMASMNPYVAAGKYKPFEGDTELVPGVRGVPAIGHTPGHSFYIVESKGQKLVLWGDLMHVAAVQFPEPGVTIQFDLDSKKASAERKKAFADAAKNGYSVGIAHVSFPGIGQLRTEGAGYRWIPVNWVSGHK